MCTGLLMEVQYYVIIALQVHVQKQLQVEAKVGVAVTKSTKATGGYNLNQKWPKMTTAVHLSTDNIETEVVSSLTKAYSS